MRRLLPAILLAVLLPAAARADTLEANGMRLVKIVDSDFALPVSVASPPGDPSRVFVVEQGSGTTGNIWVVHDGVRLADPFLALTNVRTGGESGLLSMAFAPDYATSGRFFVYYTSSTECSANGCDVAVDSFRRLDEDHADLTTRTRVFSVPHRANGNHKGGQVAFGPDGLLYAAPGDGGGTGDPPCNAQNPAVRLGKVLRADVSQPGPATPEIYALGLRNPFRFSFDHLTGDLLIGDVGQDSQEEVDFLAAGSPPGTNFGWPYFEGTFDYPESGACAPSPPATTGPSVTYPNPPDPEESAVTGGYVVRDTSLAPLLGRYLYGDFFAGQIHSAVIGPSTQSGDGPTGLQVDGLSSFGQDALCRIYVASIAGPVYRLEAVSAAGAPGCQSAPAAPAPPLPVDPAAVDRLAPGLSRVSASRRRFRVSADATPRVARAPAGTVFHYSLSERSEVSVRFYRATAGRRSKGRCVVATRRLRRAAKCTRYPLKGTLVRRRVEAGRRSIKFSGRVGLASLPPGRYRATLRARDAAGNVSPGRVLTLQIVTR